MNHASADPNKCLYNIDISDLCQNQNKSSLELLHNRCFGVPAPRPMSSLPCRPLPSSQPRSSPFQPVPGVLLRLYYFLDNCRLMSYPSLGQTRRIWVERLLSAAIFLPEGGQLRLGRDAGYKFKPRIGLGSPPPSPLESMFPGVAVSVDSKLLTDNLSLLDATLTKKQGVGLSYC